MLITSKINKLGFGVWPLALGFGPWPLGLALGPWVWPLALGFGPWVWPLALGFGPYTVFIHNCTMYFLVNKFAISKSHSWVKMFIMI